MIKIKFRLISIHIPGKYLTVLVIADSIGQAKRFIYQQYEDQYNINSFEETNENTFELEGE